MQHLPQSTNIADLRELLPTLRRLGQLYKVLAYSGENVSSFTSWSHRYRTTFVPLFDFDVVCGSLPSVAAQRRVKTFSSLRDTSLLLELGPHTLVATLLKLGQFRFSLPFGSLAELMVRRQELERGIAQNAIEWINKWEESVNSPDPGGKLLGENEQSPETVLLNTFVEIASGYDDIRILEAVCAQHIPFENLVLPTFDSKVSRSFTKTEGELKSLRPKFDRNNRLDAINISNVVRMFNHPIQERLGERPMPIFVTETKELYKIFDLGMEDSWYDLSPYGVQPPRFFKRALFLQIYWHFVTDCQFIMKTASKEALLFSRRSNEIARQYLLVADLIEAGLNPTVRGRRSVFEIEYQLDWLVEQQRVFDNDWGLAISKSLRSGEQDRISYLNLLRNERFRESVSRSVGAKIKRKQWDGAIEELQSFSPDFHFWRLIDEYADRRISLLSSEPTPLNLTMPEPEKKLLGKKILREYRLSVDQNNGESLFMERPGYALSEAPDLNYNKIHELRFLIHRRKVSNACVFCVDSWQYEEDVKSGFLALVWAHRCDRVSLLNHLQRIIRGFLIGSSDAQEVLVKKFGADGSTETAVTLKKEEALGQVAAEKDVYIEINYDSRVFYADLVPADSLEMQLGLVFPRSEVESLELPAIASFIADTNILPMTSNDCHLLLQELSQFFTHGNHIDL